MRALSRWVGTVACGALAVLLLVSAWEHVGNGAYFRTVFCLMIAALCAFAAYSDFQGKGRG